jgi:hypothetical protein
LFTESVAPELLYMEAKWSSLVSYGMSLDALQDFLPLDLTLDVKTVRYDTLKVAKRLEAELGDDQSGFIEGEPSDWDFLPPPEGFFTVGIDGGYVHNWVDKKHKFEVIVGKSILSFAEGEEDRAPSLKRFGFVQVRAVEDSTNLLNYLWLFHFLAVRRFLHNKSRTWRIFHLIWAMHTTQLPPLQTARN